jgi:hypothetical protein
MLGSAACHDGDMEAVNLDAMLTRFAGHWSPKKIAQVNDYDVRIVKIQGEFTWHRHAETDEFFLVLDGQLTIQMRDGNVVLGRQPVHPSTAKSTSGVPSNRRSHPRRLSLSAGEIRPRQDSPVPRSM